MLGFGKKQYTEEELIGDCRKGKEKARRTLYERFSPKMTAICLRYLGDPAEAEDAMITAFVKVFDNLDKFRGEGSFEGWIRRITVNEALGLVRKRKVHFEELDRAEENTDFRSEMQDLEVQDLMDMLDELPDGYRTVFNMYAIEGFGHQEIAEKLGITVGTSKSQLSKARKMLQKLLAQTEEIPAS